MDCFCYLSWTGKLLFLVTCHYRWSRCDGVKTRQKKINFRLPFVAHGRMCSLLTGLAHVRYLVAHQMPLSLRFNARTTWWVHCVKKHSIQPRIEPSKPLCCHFSNSRWCGTPSLSAYRRGYSCESVLLRLIEDWRFALDKRCVVGAVIMDLSKAFDMIPHNLLLAKLAAYGISSSSLVLLQDYLRGRSQRVKIEDVTSDVLPISKGVPQGSVLGPLFFNIFLNDLFYVIKRAKLSNYADDNQIYFCDRDPQVVKTVINDELALACKWFDDNKLVLNPTKCKALVLSIKHPLNLNFTINDVQIPCVDHLELLGVVIDNSLHFDKHVTKITKKVGKQLDVLCRFKKMLSSSTKLCLYNSFIMSYFTYCSTVWHNCMKSDSDRLDKLNERALRYIYSDRSSTYAGESTEGTSYTLADRRIQDMLILVFKAVNNLLPTYLSDLFIIRENIKNLRGTNKLVIPNVNTTRYGTKSVAFTAPKAWNSLPDRLRSMKSLKDFKIAVRSM